MSLNSAMTAEASLKCSVVLRTADQYDIWKARVTDACWAATHRDIFELTDKACADGLKAYADGKDDEKKKGVADWVGKCWMIITSSLHDDVYRKVSQTPKGKIATLLTNIGHALVVNNSEEVQPLKVELWSATMQKDAGSDLQAWVNYIEERASKLAFLGKPVDEEDMIAIFLKGLHPVFQQLQVYFAIPDQMPKKFDKAVAVVRRFATTPVVAVELAKLKSAGTSQSMFPLTAQAPKQKALCRQFARNGTCMYGARCRFAHTATPAQTPAQTQVSSTQPVPRPLICSFCNKLNHTAEVCRKRLSQLPVPTPAQPSLLAAPATTIPHVDASTLSEITSSQTDLQEFSLVFALAAALSLGGCWIQERLRVPLPARQTVWMSGTAISKSLPLAARSTFNALGLLSSMLSTRKATPSSCK
jgi:hypothetical protein